MSEKIKTVGELIQEMKGLDRGGVVADWKAHIPAGSRWHPGDPGDPACKICEGIGYLRLEGLSVNNPNFGKVFLCDCVKFR